jgi:hypothetical protein
LEKFRPILENRLRVYEEGYSWHKLHRERDQKIFEEEKIVSSIWPEYNSFGYSSYSLYLERNAFLTLKKSNTIENLKYILSILNSRLIGFWFEHKVSHRGQKYFLPKNVLGTIPIRRINFDDPQEVKIHDHLVGLVDSIIEAKERLANYHRFFPGTRLTRLQENESLPEIDDEKVVKSLESSVLRTIRTHPQIRYEPKVIDHFFLKGAKLSEDAQNLTVVSKDRQTLALTAPYGVLVYLQKILPNYQGKEWSEIIDQILIPTEPGLADKKSAEVLSQVTSLRDKIKSLQQEIDSIVFDLYGLSREEREVTMR